MHAVMETGGKQYRVAPGDVIQVEKQVGAVGERLELRPVLLLQDEQGMTFPPAMPEARVIGEILAQGRGGKVLVFKKKRRKNYRRTQGHRQAFTRLKIIEIVKG